MLEWMDKLLPLLQPIFFALRGVAALLALYLVVRCCLSIRAGQRRDVPVVFLEERSGRRVIPVLYWENSIGRSKSCDVVLADPAVSRDHAVLFRREAGWLLTDTGSKSGTRLNGQAVTGTAKVLPGDTISLGRTDLVLRRVTDSSERLPQRRRGRPASQSGLLSVATVVQLLLFVQACFGSGGFSLLPVLPCVVVLGLEWGYYAVSRHLLRRPNFELETLGFLLAGVGIALLSGTRGKLPKGTAQPSAFALFDNSMRTVYTQLFMMALGLCLFSFLLWFMKDLDRVNKWRTPAALAGVLLLALPLLPGIGQEIYGSRNWISLGGLSFQPSEITKICFIFAGAATLDRLQTKKNLFSFICLMALVLGILILEKDIGGAAVFFMTFLIIAFMRSGSLRTIILSVAAAGLGIATVLLLMDHVRARFAGWRHVWEYVNERQGYQQTRVLTYSASGGLFGVGIGNGGLGGGTLPLSGKTTIAANTSDLVFGMLIEELGLLMAVVLVAGLASLLLYARSGATRSRSTFYSITACAAAGLLLFQCCLHIFGSTDVLPLTGVTLPFISAGGSSMMAVWGLLAFLKASDERSYAVRRRDSI